jgi:hypothetical protein
MHHQHCSDYKKLLKYNQQFVTKKKRLWDSALEHINLTFQEEKKKSNVGMKRFFKRINSILYFSFSFVVIAVLPRPMMLDFFDNFKIIFLLKTFSLKFKGWPAPAIHSAMIST